MCRSWGDNRINGGMVDRQGIHEQEDWAPKELQGDVGSAKIARHEANMCRAPLCSSAVHMKAMQGIVERVKCRMVKV